jgi:uridine kinase
LACTIGNGEVDSSILSGSTILLAAPRATNPGIPMKRVLIIGPGGSGKSTLALRLCEITGLPAIELDKIFWQPGLVPLPRERWAEVQRELIAGDAWIIDGDLGPYDVIDIRLRAADTVIFLDFSIFRCALRAIRRSRQRFDFWLWLFSYRWKHRPAMLAAIRTYAGNAEVRVLRDPRAVERFLNEMSARPPPPPSSPPA